MFSRWNNMQVNQSASELEDPFTSFAAVLLIGWWWDQGWSWRDHQKTNRILIRNSNYVFLRRNSHNVVSLPDFHLSPDCRSTEASWFKCHLSTARLVNFNCLRHAGNCIQFSFSNSPNCQKSSTLRNSFWMGVAWSSLARLYCPHDEAAVNLDFILLYRLMNWL